MLSNDLKKYAKNTWCDYLEPVSKLSLDKRSGIPLVSSEHSMYNFDEIVKNSLKQKLGSSVDALTFHGRCIELVEFKSGFVRKITKNNFNPEKAECEITHEVCEPYWNIFKELKKKERKELLDSLHMKALESYIMLEKEFCPLSPGPTKDRVLTLVVVIDFDCVDNYENDLADLAGKPPAHDNPIPAIKQSLSKLSGHTDHENNSYLYDCISIMSATEFKILLDSRKEE